MIDAVFLNSAQFECEPLNAALGATLLQKVETLNPAEGADAKAASWKEHRMIERARVNTIADGIAVRRPVAEALADMDGLVDDVLLVSEGAIERAMRLAFHEAGLVVEPAGVVGIAAVIEHPSLRSQRLATVL